MFVHIILYIICIYMCKNIYTYIPKLKVGYNGTWATLTQT